MFRIGNAIVLGAAVFCGSGEVAAKPRADAPALSVAKVPPPSQLLSPQNAERLPKLVAEYERYRRNPAAYFQAHDDLVSAPECADDLERVGIPEPLEQRKELAKLDARSGNRPRSIDLVSMRVTRGGCLNGKLNGNIIVLSTWDVTLFVAQKEFRQLRTTTIASFNLSDGKLVGDMLIASMSGSGPGAPALVFSLRSSIPDALVLSRVVYGTHEEFETTANAIVSVRNQTVYKSRVFAGNVLAQELNYKGVIQHGEQITHAHMKMGYQIPAGTACFENGEPILTLTCEVD